MKKVASIVTALVVMFTAFLTFTSPAHAAQVVYWKGAVSKTSVPLNATPPENANKIIIVTLRVPRGERIRDAGFFTLDMRNAPDLTIEGYIVPGKKHRVAEYYLFPDRNDKVDRAHPRDSWANLVRLTRGAEGRITLRADFLGMVP